jgi:ABC-type ATPase with predicted acetyltransferase domain
VRTVKVHATPKLVAHTVVDVYVERIDGRFVQVRIDGVAYNFIEGDQLRLDVETTMNDA